MTLTALVCPDVDVEHLTERDRQRVTCIERVITAEVTRQVPSATAWSVTATNAASGRPTHFYFDEPVTARTPRGDRDVTMLGTPASGAAYELSLYLHAREGVVHTVNLTEGSIS